MAIAVSMMMAMGCRKVCVCMHARARQVQERVGEVEGGGAGGGRKLWATGQLHINLTSLILLLSHIVSLPFPSRQDRIQRLSFGTQRARTGSAHSRRPPSPTDQCLSVTPLPSLSLCSQHFIITCYHQPIETRAQPRQTASYAPVPALPDPASVSIVSSPPSHATTELAGMVGMARRGLAVGKLLVGTLPSCRAYARQGKLHDRSRHFMPCPGNISLVSQPSGAWRWR